MSCMLPEPLVAISSCFSCLGVSLLLAVSPTLLEQVLCHPRAVLFCDLGSLRDSLEGCGSAASMSPPAHQQQAHKLITQLHAWQCLDQNSSATLHPYCRLISKRRATGTRLRTGGWRCGRPSSSTTCCRSRPSLWCGSGRGAPVRGCVRGSRGGWSRGPVCPATRLTCGSRWGAEPA